MINSYIFLLNINSSSTYKYKIVIMFRFLKNVKYLKIVVIVMD